LKLFDLSKYLIYFYPISESKKRNAMIIFDDTLNEEFVQYIRRSGVISPEQNVLKLEKLTGGNMNFVMRVFTDFTSFIFKQSRTYVEKYPTVLAPSNRIEIEAQFYDTIGKKASLNKYVPGVLFVDLINYVIILEDLGVCTDFTSMYRDDLKISSDDGRYLIDFLLDLHSMSVVEYPSNQSMRELNNEHIFNYPFMLDNGFDLDGVLSGLSAISMPYKQDDILQEKIKLLSKIYLGGKPKSLLHGDFYPGSWLATDDGIKIIDHEFSYMGSPEFDLGVMIGHLYITRHSDAFINELITYYHSKNHLDTSLVYAFAGIEILRRIMGLAQLPIKLNLSEREALLALGASMVKMN
jgi:5-methylthioribose kinase